MQKNGLVRSPSGDDPRVLFSEGIVLWDDVEKLAAREINSIFKVDFCIPAAGFDMADGAV